ncbi:hypothetical protein TIFTF001_023022 [Ficus carica]|uniref:Uncharacterized protein n=1 Tax=Ficus carica TaxID=3494 RepID=A0AA88AZU5_FICCA|nr:hypothetical protein TIFTF001_023022 [Ficus carica]
MEFSKVSSSELLGAHSRLWYCSVSYMKAMSLKCAIELGIPDIIHSHGQSITFSKLIASLPVHPSKTRCVFSLMRILVHSGFFESRKVDKIDQKDDDEEEEEYSLTLTSRLLLNDAPLRMKEFFLSSVLPQTMSQMHSLSSWLQNSDTSAYKTTGGMTLWESLAQDSRLAHIFNETMASDSKLTSKIILDECSEVFEGLKSLVDVGGGTGTLARAIANAYPNLKCTVFDLPRVVANLQGTENLDFVGGDMFSDPIPPADAILLKWILHDWNDEDSLKILKRCREAILRNGKGGKVIIIDMVIGSQNTDELTGIQLCNDVIMMATFFSMERSLKEWEKLFFDAGFSHYKINPKLGVRSLIELYP